jgi:hypothetical protein
MKRFFLSLFTASTILLTGCYETTQEITVKEDGSGSFSTINDMSALMGMAKQMGGGADMEKMGDQAIDSSFSLEKGADSIPNLSPEERDIVRKGQASIKMNMKEDKFITGFVFPFSSPSEIGAINKLSGKIMMETMKGQAGAGASGALGGQEMPQFSSFDDYYTMSFSKGSLTKKLNKEKYATAADDQYLKSLKEAAGMGLAMKVTYIMNLPKPAKKAEGKGIKLSEDKKKVTIEADIDDFFDDPSKLEFNIEY